MFRGDVYIPAVGGDIHANFFMYVFLSLARYTRKVFHVCFFVFGKTYAKSFLCMFFADDGIYTQ